MIDRNKLIAAKNKLKFTIRAIEAEIKVLQRRTKDMKKKLKDARKMVSSINPKKSRDGMLEVMEKMNTSFLAIKNQMQQESRQFNTLSNLMKTQHDNAMNSIRNIRI